MAHIHPGNVIDTLRLASIQGEQVAIPHKTRLTHLQFRRFAGCPMCNLHIQSFIRRSDDLLAHGIQEAAVFHSSREAMLQHHAHAPFPLIADPTKSLYRAFGVEPSLMAVLHPKAWRAAIKGLFKHGVGLPASGESVTGLPADFLIDSNGVVVSAKYGKHAYDQWEVDELLTLAKNVRTP